MVTKVYRVDGMTCAHCVSAVSEEIAKIEGIDSFDVNLDTKLVTVGGIDVNDEKVVFAIDEAGYEALVVSTES